MKRRSFTWACCPSFGAEGLGRLLLRRAVSTTSAHGVWRIYCDTATTNDPMISLFESEGWTRLPEREVPL
jgi:L-amino acid N-acyltransferase YncA